MSITLYPWMAGVGINKWGGSRSLAEKAIIKKREKIVLVHIANFWNKCEYSTTFSIFWTRMEPTGHWSYWPAAPQVTDEPGSTHRFPKAPQKLVEVIPWVQPSLRRARAPQSFSPTQALQPSLQLSAKIQTPAVPCKRGQWDLLQCQHRHCMLPGRGHLVQIKLVDVCLGLWDAVSLHVSMARPLPFKLGVYRLDTQLSQSPICTQWLLQVELKHL